MIRFIAILLTVAADAWLSLPPPSAESAPRRVPGDDGPAPASTSSFLPATTSTARGIAAGAGAHSRRHYGFKCSVFFTTDPRPGSSIPAARTSRAGGVAHGRPHGRLPALPGFSRRRDAARRRLSRSRRSGRGVPHRTHAFQILRSDAKFLKYTWKGVEGYAGGFGRQISRDLGHALRQEHAQAPGCYSRPTSPRTRPARCEGRVVQSAATPRIRSRAAISWRRGRSWRG